MLGVEYFEHNRKGYLGRRCTGRRKSFREILVVLVENKQISAYVDRPLGLSSMSQKGLDHSSEKTNMYDYSDEARPLR